MPHSKHQMVFPFLADDPGYLRDLREERIIEETKAALEPVLRDQMADILLGLAKTEFKAHLETRITDAVEHVIKDVRDELHRIDRNVYALHQHRPNPPKDPADWWKRGGEPDDNEEYPL